MRLETLTADWVQQHSLALVGRNKEAAGTIQVPQPCICLIHPLTSSLTLPTFSLTLSDTPDLLSGLTVSGIIRLQVATMFVPLAREGWIQKLVASALHPFGQWRVFWLELLQDGKLSWFDTAAKTRCDFR